MPKPVPQVRPVQNICWVRAMQCVSISPTVQRDGPGKYTVLIAGWKYPRANKDVTQSVRKILITIQ